MAVTNYINLGETIFSEEPVGGTRVDYATDALGSVTGTLANGSLQNVYFYKPYGTLLQRSGAGTDPAFVWVGSVGYRSTGRTHAESYVRARHVGTPTGRWSTKDHLWPAENAYSYCASNPATRIDPSGFNPRPTCGTQTDDYALSLVWTFLVEAVGCADDTKHGVCASWAIVKGTVNMNADVDVYAESPLVLADYGSRHPVVSCKAHWSWSWYTTDIDFYPQNCGSGEQCIGKTYQRGYSGAGNRWRRGQGNITSSLFLNKELNLPFPYDQTVFMSVNAHLLNNFEYTCKYTTCLSFKKIGLNP